MNDDENKISKKQGSKTEQYIKEVNYYSYKNWIICLLIGYSNNKAKVIDSNY